MKAIIFLCLIAVAAAQDDERNAEILRNDFSIDAGEGSYQADMETSNGIRMRSSGISYPGNQEGEGSFFTEGEYSYTDKKGRSVVVRYTADEKGYLPVTEIHL